MPGAEKFAIPDADARDAAADAQTTWLTLRLQRMMPRVVLGVALILRVAALVATQLGLMRGQCLRERLLSDVGILMLLNAAHPFSRRFFQWTLRMCFAIILIGHGLYLMPRMAAESAWVAFATQLIINDVIIVSVSAKLFRPREALLWNVLAAMWALGMPRAIPAARPYAVDCAYPTIALHLVVTATAFTIILQDKSLDWHTARAHRLMRARAQFIAAMSHEVRTPLNGLMGLAAALLETRPLHASQRALIDGIQSCARVLLSLSTRALQYSMRTADTSVTTASSAVPSSLSDRALDEPISAHSRRPFALRAVLEDAVLAASVPPTTGVHVSLAPDTLADTRFGDPDRLLELVLAMLEHSRRRCAASPGAGRMVLRVQPASVRRRDDDAAAPSPPTDLAFTVWDDAAPLLAAARARGIDPLTRASRGDYRLAAARVHALSMGGTLCYAETDDGDDARSGSELERAALTPPLYPVLRAVVALPPYGNERDSAPSPVSFAVPLPAATAAAVAAGGGAATSVPPPATVPAVEATSRAAGWALGDAAGQSWAPAAASPIRAATARSEPAAESDGADGFRCALVCDDAIAVAGLCSALQSIGGRLAMPVRVASADDEGRGALDTVLHDARALQLPLVLLVQRRADPWRAGDLDAVCAAPQRIAVLLAAPARVLSALEQSLHRRGPDVLAALQCGRLQLLPAPLLLGTLHRAVATAWQVVTVPPPPPPPPLDDALSPPAAVPTLPSRAGVTVVAAAAPAPDAIRFAPGSRVLLVDDSELNLLVLQLLLRDLRIECDLELSGEGALQRCCGCDAPAARYAAVLMDVNMPGMDGLETTRRLRRYERHGSWPRVPIIAVTASEASEMAAACAAVGMDGFLTKPVTKVMLLDALGRVMRTQTAHASM